MTRIEQLRDIAKRLEEAMQADHRIDFFLRRVDAFSGPVFGSLSYTGSIDAALGLVERVLPGWITSSANQAVTLGDSNPTWFWELDDPQSPDATPQGRSAPTAPLAILKALFAVLIQQEKSK